MRPHRAQDGPPRPWSPLSVSVITFLLPAGGAVLTVQNLERLKAVDARGARLQALGVTVLYAIGLAIVLALAPLQSDGAPQLDPGTYTVIQCGFAGSAYVVQRSPFRSWRHTHPRGTSLWTSGLLTAVVYQVAAVLIAAPLYVLFFSVLGNAGV